MQKPLEDLLTQDNDFGYYRTVSFYEFCNVVGIDKFHPDFKKFVECWNTAIRSACNGFINAEDTDFGFSRTLCVGEKDVR